MAGRSDRRERQRHRQSACGPGDRCCQQPEVAPLRRLVGRQEELLELVDHEQDVVVLDTPWRLHGGSPSFTSGPGGPVRTASRAITASVSSRGRGPGTSDERAIAPIRVSRPALQSWDQAGGDRGSTCHNPTVRRWRTAAVPVSCSRIVPTSAPRPKNRRIVLAIRTKSLVRIACRLADRRPLMRPHEQCRTVEEDPLV